MANTIGWGQAAVNNTIDWGKGKTNNAIGWGSVAEKAAGWSCVVVGTRSNAKGGLSLLCLQSYCAIRSVNHVCPAHRSWLRHPPGRLCVKL